MSNARNLARLLPNASGQLPDAAMSSGSVIQVVQAVFNGQYARSMASAAFADITGWSASITPTSANSKILAKFNVVGGVDLGGSSLVQWATFGVRLIRNGAALTNSYGNVNSSFNGQSAASVAGWENLNVATGEFLDSPNSTSQQTYLLQLGTHGAGGYTVRLNSSGRNSGGSEAGNGNYISTLTLMEIAA